MPTRYTCGDYLLIYSQSLTMWSNLLIVSLYYNSGESYKFHMDGFNYDDVQNLHPERGSQRTYTFMIYLSDVEEGGATFFPKLNKRFNPEKGKAVIWNNLNDDGTRNHNTTHTGECVVKGQKYIITKWFRIGIVKR